MKNYLSLAFIVTALLSSTALAEIYKRVDPDGRITYSNVKTKGATRLELDPDANTISNDRAKASSGSKRTATPEGFPRVDKDTQKVIGEKAWFIDFFSPWCSHCRQFAPTWDEFYKIH